MRLGCVSYLLPGGSTDERLANAARIGLDVTEFLVFPDADLRTWLRDVQRASEASGVGVCAVIACQSMLDPAHLPWFRAVLDAGAELGAVVVLTPEYAGRSAPASAPPLPAPPRAEFEAVKRMLTGISAQAEQVGARAAVEAINRYETRFVRNLDEALSLVGQAGPNIGVVADFFHMNLEEHDIAASLVRAGSRLMHVHLADSNRYVPGWGHLDFEPGFRALRSAAYSSALSLECGLPTGRPDELAQAVSRVREMWNRTGESITNAGH